MKDEKSNVSHSNELIKLITGIIPNNEKFLLEKTTDAYNEVIELMNDAVDNVVFFSEDKNKRGYLKSTLFFFTHHILLPYSYAIYTDLMVGNLPACFMELRAMLEALAKCYFAESYESNFHMEKILMEEKHMKSNHKTITRLVSELDEELNLMDNAKMLWKTISNDWIHVKGIIHKWIEGFSNKEGYIPSYRLIIPTGYSDEDIPVIFELQKSINQFRNILELAMEKYKIK